LSYFRKHICCSIHLNINGTHLAELIAIDDASAKHFKSAHNNCRSIDLSRPSHSSEFLSLARVSEADVCKAIKTLKPSKSVGLDDIPGFIIKGCSAIFIPILRHIFNLSLTRQYFPAAWKEAAVVPVLQRGNHAAMSNYRPIYILNISPKLFEFIIRDHVSYYDKFNQNHQNFTRTKSQLSIRCHVSKS
jgi:hypothetical protein